MDLHDVPRLGVAVACAVFAATFALRVAGISTPDDFYFDEPAHVRTTSEVIAGRAGDPTLTPVPVLIRAASVRALGGITSTRPIRVARLASPIAGGPHGRLAFVERGTRPSVVRVDVDAACTPREVRRHAVDGRVDALSVGAGGAVLAAVSDRTGSSVRRIAGDRVEVVAPAADGVVAVAETAGVVHVLSSAGDLYRAGPTGLERIAGGLEPPLLAVDADSSVWAFEPARSSVASFRLDGRRRSVRVRGVPSVLAAVVDEQRGAFPHALRLAAVGPGGRLELVDPLTGERRDVAGRTRAVAALPGGFVWADGTDGVRVIDARSSGTVAAGPGLRRSTHLLADPVRGRVIAVGDDAVWCLGSKTRLAMRLPSAVAGAATAAAAALMAARLTGGLLAGTLAGALVAAEGLSHVLARMVMNDAYVAAFGAAAWVLALTAIHERERRDGATRAATTAMLAAGLCLGLAAASKWTGILTWSGVAGLLAWDSWRRRASIRLAAEAVRTAVCLVVVPAAAYVVPSLAATGTRLARSALVPNLEAAAVYSLSTPTVNAQESAWYGWPFGGGSLRIYVAPAPGAHELWLAGNRVVLIGGAIAAFVLAASGLTSRRLGPLVPAVAVAVVSVPWAALDRPGFVYHYLPAVAPLGVAAAWVLTLPRRRGPRCVAVAAGLAATIAAFVLALPLLDAWPVSPGYRDAVRPLVRLNPFG